MANKIKLARGTKANIEANKSSLLDYEIVYSTDGKEIGVKNADGTITYFLNKDWSTLPTQSTPPTLDDYLVINGATTTQRVTVGNLLALVDTGIFKTVSELPAMPATGEENKIYLVPVDEDDTDFRNDWNEYIWVDGGWELIGQLKIDLSDYSTKGDTSVAVSTAISNHDDSDTAHQDIRTSLSKKLPQEVFTNEGKPETYIRVTNIRNDQNTVQAMHIHDSGTITLGGTKDGLTSKVKLANGPIDDMDAATKFYVDSKTMKLINSGSSTALSKTTYRTFTVPSDSYAGKTVAVEIKYGSSSSTTYTNKVIYVTLGTNTSTEASKTYPRFITLSEWDGEYLKHISVKAYVDSGTTTSINFGHVKTLIGRFTGSTIDWTTQANDNINVYIGKIWLVG